MLDNGYKLGYNNSIRQPEIKPMYKKLQINGLYGDLQPIEPSYKPIKKELKGNDYLKLFGALYFLLDNNKELIEEFYNITIEQGMEDAAIQDNELYLNSFEGYELNERYTIKTLYIDTNDNIVMSVYDYKYNRFLDFIA